MLLPLQLLLSVLRLVRSKQGTQAAHQLPSPPCLSPGILYFNSLFLFTSTRTDKMHKNSKPFDGGELAKTKSSTMVARKWCLNQTWNYCCTCVPLYVCRFLKKYVGVSSFFFVGPARASAPIQPLETSNPSKKQNSKRGGKKRRPSQQ